MSQQTPQPLDIWRPRPHRTEPIVVLNILKDERECMVMYSTCTIQKLLYETVQRNYFYAGSLKDPVLKLLEKI